MFGRLPSGTSQWITAVQLVAGGLLAWITHPLVWIAFGPARWCAFLLATSAQESTYNNDAVGDGGRSVGALQFYDSTWEGLGMGDLDRRKSAWWSTWAAAKYVGDAFATDIGWVWRLAIPYYGAGYGRLLWVNGVSSGLTRSFDQMVSYWDSEGAARTAWNTWRLISLPFTVMIYRYGSSRVR